MMARAPRDDGLSFRSQGTGSAPRFSGQILAGLADLTILALLSVTLYGVHDAHQMARLRMRFKTGTRFRAYRRRVAE
jgi:hypothetical protein